MGYSDFDRALLDAWYAGYRVYHHVKGDPAKLDAILRLRAVAAYAGRCVFEIGF